MTSVAFEIYFDRCFPSVTNSIASFFTEIAKVRASLFQINGVKKEPLVLPEAEGMVTTLTEKVYVPVKEHPDVSSFNLVEFRFAVCGNTSTVHLGPLSAVSIEVICSDQTVFTLQFDGKVKISVHLGNPPFICLQCVFLGLPRFGYIQYIFSCRKNHRPA